jgi:cytochrome c oxidase subunit II
MLLAARDTRQIYDGVAPIYLIVAAVVFAIVVLTLVVFLVLYRARPGREPGDRAEAPRMELVYGAFLVLVTAALLVITYTAEGREDALGSSSSGRPLRVDVVAAQWKWRFSYPGTPVVQEPPGAGNATVLYLPAGRPVRFSGHSQDVLHDFWVPDLRFQRQVWPDHTERWGMLFPKVGTYEGVCAWFCGLYHESMHFEVRVLAPARFDAWLRRRERAGA